MYKKFRRSDTVMLAAALFALSGSILAYNLSTVGSGKFSVSLSELAAYAEPIADSIVPSAITASAAANLAADDSIYVSAVPAKPIRSYELLEPIVKPPVA